MTFLYRTKRPPFSTPISVPFISISTGLVRSNCERTKRRPLKLKGRDVRTCRPANRRRIENSMGRVAIFCVPLRHNHFLKKNYYFKFSTFFKRNISFILRLNFAIVCKRIELIYLKNRCSLFQILIIF